MALVEAEYCQRIVMLCLPRFDFGLQHSLVGNQVLPETRHVLLAERPFDPRIIPVRDLDRQQHANHDDQEIERDGEPVLVLHMLGEAAEDHGSRAHCGRPSAASRGVAVSQPARSRLQTRPDVHVRMACSFMLR